MPGTNHRRAVPASEGGNLNCTIPIYFGMREGLVGVMLACAARGRAELGVFLHPACACEENSYQVFGFMLDYKYQESPNCTANSSGWRGNKEDRAEAGISRCPSTGVPVCLYPLCRLATKGTYRSGLDEITQGSIYTHPWLGVKVKSFPTPPFEEKKFSILFLFPSISHLLPPLPQGAPRTTQFLTACLLSIVSNCACSAVSSPHTQNVCSRSEVQDLRHCKDTHSHPWRINCVAGESLLLIHPSVTVSCGVRSS